MVLTVSFALSPVTGLSCHRQRIPPRSLMPASGHQDHTTSPSACSIARQARRRVHRIPLRVRDVAQRPSEERDGTGYKGDLGLRKTRIFFRKGLDGKLDGRTDLPVRQICQPLMHRDQEARLDEEPSVV